MVAATLSFSSTRSRSSVSTRRSALLEKHSTESMSTAVASPPKRGHSHHKKTSFEELQSSLQRFTRGNDRRLAIRSLTDCAALRTIPIDGSPASPSSPEEWKNLEREVCFSSVDLNGVMFPAAAASQILKILKELCAELCRDSGLSSHSVYQAMIVRLARTTSSADAYFRLNALLGSEDLVLQPRVAATPPTSLTMYESNGAIHATVTTYHPYGLFRRCDVTSGKAWIPLQAAIHERVNFVTGDCFRHVGVEVVRDD